MRCRRVHGWWLVLGSFAGGGATLGCVGESPCEYTATCPPPPEAGLEEEGVATSEVDESDTPSNQGEDSETDRRTDAPAPLPTLPVLAPMFPVLPVSTESENDGGIAADELGNDAGTDPSDVEAGEGTEPTELVERDTDELDVCAENNGGCDPSLECVSTTTGTVDCVAICPTGAGPERICTAECPCDTAEGSCTTDTDCQSGLVCTADAIAKLGYPGASCLPAHCTNDVQDAEETSVDCGGGCGCRATFEIIPVTGVPSDAVMGQISAMSGDGRVFAGTIGRDRMSYPMRINEQGVITELEGWGVGGRAEALSFDGNVIVGTLGCGNPPECDDPEGGAFRWTGDEPPALLIKSALPTAVSSSGAVVGGHITTADGVFRYSAGLTRINSSMRSVSGMSGNGLFMAGSLTEDADRYAVWSISTDYVQTFDPPGTWSRWEISRISSDGTVFIGTTWENNTSRPFICRDGVFAALPLLPNATSSSLYGLSADGEVVAGNSGSNSFRQAFVWDQPNGIRTVLAELAQRGMELSIDLHLDGVRFMGDDGRILVGEYTRGENHSLWRATLLD